MTKGEPSDWALETWREMLDAGNLGGGGCNDDRCLDCARAALILDEARAQWEREVVEWLRVAEVQHLGVDFESANRIARAIERGEHRPKP